MAWRKTPYVTFVANSTVITAAFLNACQAAINDLFNGSFSLAKGYVDGVGDVAVPGGLAAGEWRALLLRATTSGLRADAGGLDVTGAATLRTGGTVSGGIWDTQGASGDTSGTRRMSSAPTTRKLVDEWTTGGATQVWGRWYTVNGSGGINSSVEFTINASWNGSLWVADAASLYAFKVTFRPSNTAPLNFQQYSGGLSTWNDASWNWGSVISLVAGGIVFSGTLQATSLTASTGNITATAGQLIAGATRSSSTAGSGQSVALGAIYRDTAPIAWAQVSSAGALIRGANINSVIKNGGMGNYTVNVVNGVTVTGQLVAVMTVHQTMGLGYVSQGTTGITVQTFDTSGMSADRGFNVVIFGGG
jgi:hypothetical protein